MRYFLEVYYHGQSFAGFQKQDNAVTIQSVIEQALLTLFRLPFALTGSSRTDAGVHARQNFFHVDTDILISQKHIYNLNALLPPSIAIRHCFPMPANAHCRFDAIFRRYVYHIYTEKNPFLTDRAWLYPYPLLPDVLQECANKLLLNSDFTSFCKRNSQVKTMICTLSTSQWQIENGHFTYTVQGNRFLRGMVRGMVGTMLLAGRGKISIADFEQIIAAKDCTLANFTVPAHGLCLDEVGFASTYFPTKV